MANLSFRESLRRYVPAWLSDRPGKSVGFRFLYGLAAILDAGMQFLLEGIQARLPGIGTPTALPYLGRDRVIRRGPGESAESFAARLVSAPNDWDRAGASVALLNQLAGFLAPSPPKMRVVHSSAYASMWRTRNPDGSHEYFVSETRNWDWDSQTNPAGVDLWARCWVILYSAGGPWAPAGDWGGGSTWNGGQLWGFTASPEQVTGIRQIVADWGAAHCVHPWVIIAFDEADPAFLPATDPGDPGALDGWWGNWHKVVSGVAVPTRTATARYFEGASS